MNLFSTVKSTLIEIYVSGSYIWISKTCCAVNSCIFDTLDECEKLGFLNGEHINSFFCTKIRYTLTNKGIEYLKNIIEEENKTQKYSGERGGSKGYRIRGNSRRCRGGSRIGISSERRLHHERNDRGISSSSIVTRRDYRAKHDYYDRRPKTRSIDIDKLYSYLNNLDNNEIEKQHLNTPNLSIDDVHSFLEWLNKQQKDYLGGEFLYDIKGYYKRLKQTEMFDYWLKNIYSK